jgi:hypothetical protein
MPLKSACARNGGSANSSSIRRNSVGLNPGSRGKGPGRGNKRQFRKRTAFYLQPSLMLASIRSCRCARNGSRRCRSKHLNAGSRRGVKGWSSVPNGVSLAALRDGKSPSRSVPVAGLDTDDRERTMTDACADQPRYRVVTPWWAAGLIRLGEWLIALGERGRWLDPLPPEGR